MSPEELLKIQPWEWTIIGALALLRVTTFIFKSLFFFIRSLK
jgi:hypothetical protein